MMPLLNQDTLKAVKDAWAIYSAPRGTYSSLDKKNARHQILEYCVNNDIPVTSKNSEAESLQQVIHYLNASPMAAINYLTDTKNNKTSTYATHPRKFLKEINQDILVIRKLIETYNNEANFVVRVYLLGKIAQQKNH